MQPLLISDSWGLYERPSMKSSSFLQNRSRLGQEDAAFLVDVSDPAFDDEALAESHG